MNIDAGDCLQDRACNMFGRVLQRGSSLLQNPNTDLTFYLHLDENKKGTFSLMRTLVIYVVIWTEDIKIVRNGIKCEKLLTRDIPQCPKSVRFPHSF